MIESTTYLPKEICQEREKKKAFKGTFVKWQTTVKKSSSVKPQPETVELMNTRTTLDEGSRPSELCPRSASTPRASLSSITFPSVHTLQTSAHQLLVAVLHCVKTVLNSTPRFYLHRVACVTLKPKRKKTYPCVGKLHANLEYSLRSTAHQQVFVLYAVRHFIHRDHVRQEEPLFTTSPWPGDGTLGRGSSCCST